MAPLEKKVICPVCEKSRFVSKSNYSSAKNRSCMSCAQKQVQRKRFPPSRKGVHSGVGYIGSDGYMNISVGVKKYKKEHRLVVEEHIGRELASSEVVHHINLDKLDNRIENLYLCNRENDHRIVHISLDNVVKKLINLGIISFSDGEYYVAVGKLRELLEQPEEVDQQPSP